MLRFGGGVSKVLLLTLILTLILILLPPKGGLGAQPQGFYFVSLPEGGLDHRFGQSLWKMLRHRLDSRFRGNPDGCNFSDFFVIPAKAGIQNE